MPNLTQKETEEEIIARLDAARERIFKETGEKECGICGAWFKPANGNQKYCEKCRKKSDVKRKWMAHDMERSVYFNGRGTKPQMYTLVCKECGKEFEYPREQGKDFCSAGCRTAYRRKHAVCRCCGRNLFSLGIDVSGDIRDDFLFCGEECREKYKWDNARETHDIAICKNCGAEIIGRERKFCCAACQREYAKKNAKGKQKTEHTCMHCGRTFLHYGDKKFCSRECYLLSVEAVKKGGPDLTEYEKEERRRIKRQKDLKKKQVEKAQKKKAEKADAKTDEYIVENGLCSICRTSYTDCERMQTNFRMSPKGAVFKGSVIIKCPKFTNGWKKEEK